MAYQEQDGILEAPAFTRYVSGYLADDGTGNYKTRWRLHQNMETLSLEQEDFGSFVGQIQDVAKDEEAAAHDLLLLPRRTTNLADYALRQGRSFRPCAETKASLKGAIDLSSGLGRPRSLRSRGNRGGEGNEQEKDFRRNDGRCCRDEKPSRGQNHAAHLQR